MRLTALALACALSTGPLSACAAESPATQPLSPEAPRMAVEPPPRRMPGTPGPGQVEPQCDAEAARPYVGREASEDVVEAARQAAGAQVVRTLSPGQMVTMEYHFSRLTLDVDEDNVIVGVRCG